MHEITDPWAEVDDAVLKAVADGTALPDYGVEHVDNALAENVRAGRLTLLGMTGTVYRVTPAGRAHLQQTPTSLTKAA